MVIRKTTLLPTATGVLVGLNKVFTTLSAAELIAIVTLEKFVAVTPLAVAEFVAVPVASVMKLTVRFVLWPGVRVPRFVHVSVVALVTFGVTLAELKLNLPEVNTSLTDTLGSVVLPMLTIYKL